MRLYWALFHPSRHGALVAVWYQGKILLVRNSYVRYYSLPGGYVRSHESAREAARRELAEEVGLELTLDELEPALSREHAWEGKRERVDIFQVQVTDPPKVEVDHREVIQAGFFAAADALTLDLFPPLREVIELWERTHSSGEPARVGAGP
jgi:ADP-ribose pyrophosphatase YjhB (NUDIX family)